MTDHFLDGTRNRLVASQTVGHGGCSLEFREKRRELLYQRGDLTTTISMYSEFIWYKSKWSRENLNEAR